ncbi:hypothetical protein SDC9_113473 [bioreactor metagenome]|uniref:Uncharacterized protein n=1 Tax=bioreactor metagenome TaxID=1076179 RepID=A0A645BTJ6_9ZZZZ
MGANRLGELRQVGRPLRSRRQRPTLLCVECGLQSVVHVGRGRPRRIRQNLAGRGVLHGDGLVSGSELSRDVVAVSGQFGHVFSFFIDGWPRCTVFG